MHLPVYCFSFKYIDEKKYPDINERERKRKYDTTALRRYSLFLRIRIRLIDSLLSHFSLMVIYAVNTSRLFFQSNCSERKYNNTILNDFVSQYHEEKKILSEKYTPNL
jgi:hypothetical protein